MELVDLLMRTVEKKGSDLFLIPGAPATAKVGGALVAVSEETLMPKDTERLVDEAYRLAGNRSRAPLDEGGDDDFSFSLARVSRFRCNAYRQRGSLAATCRVVAFGLPDPAALHIPDLVMALAGMRGGMILVTGPAGSGKSTTLACMIDRINATRGGHIITIEDPIEYLHSHKQSLVSQREVPNDAGTFQRALRAALREAPDVIMLGENRHHGRGNGAFAAFLAAHGGRGQDGGPHCGHLPAGPAAAGAHSAFHGAARGGFAAAGAGARRRAGAGFRGDDGHACGAEHDPRWQNPPDR